MRLPLRGREERIQRRIPSVGLKSRLLIGKAWIIAPHSHEGVLQSESYFEAATLARERRREPKPEIGIEAKNKNSQKEK